MTIFDKIIIIIKLVSRDDLWVIGTITDDSDIAIESNESYLSIDGSITDVLNLLVDG